MREAVGTVVASDRFQDLPATSEGDERGEVTTQVVLGLPVLLTVLFVVIHIALASHIGHVAVAAAQIGVETATHAGGGTGNRAVVSKVEEAIAALGGSLVAPPVIVRGARRVSVTVDARVPSLVPFLPSHVRRTAVANIEQFLTEGER